MPIPLRCTCGHPLMLHSRPDGDPTLSGHAMGCAVEVERMAMAKAEAERERRHDELMIANEVPRRCRKFDLRQLKWEAQGS